ncbi:HlyD family type I secretion periplasmic adaptor subunit [Chelativorans sp. M5D2P16]|uniref:HlyD family type I secretion periplasmic adaptor subunit n=1 Tax=Chelativorans sp. M5D2P16 TaxID=3095678 RepID=UPI002ACA06DF|nr:HlyD family type I secretion periplasmic adaptor subunit [Chelativorans sp. M5D2P16]MDZ5697092.1 HlyD family type I secretion periplasmic adaptor subunit [Chelativorans sp. M5D2P16]
MPAASSEHNGSGGDNTSAHTRVWPWILAGVAVIAIAFGGAGAWGATVPLASAVVASGQITVDTNRKQVQHLEGGIVADLHVRNGDTVAGGDILIHLDGTKAKAQLAIVETAHREELAKEARLVAERDGRETIDWPEALATADTDPEVVALRRSQTAIFHSRRETLAGETGILRERVEQLKQEIEGLSAQRDSTDKQITLISDELEPLRGLFEGGHTTKQRLLALEREAARLQGERGKLTADIARARNSIGETKLAILQKKKAFLNEVVSTLREVQSKTVDLRERMIAAEDVLRRLDIRAPVSGKIVNMAVHSEDAVIKGGETILEIVPSGDRLLVEVRVRPQDIDNVAIGQPADVRMLAFKQRTTPTLAGRVSYVSADALTSPENDATFYLARIRVPEAELARLKGRELQPGMPAEVMIRTGERTAVAYMLQPLIDSMSRAWREE